MQKNGQLAVGSSPCERCGKPSEVLDPKGQLLCIACKRKQDPGFESFNTKTVKMAADHSGESQR